MITSALGVVQHCPGGFAWMLSGRSQNAMQVTLNYLIDVIMYNTMG